MLSVPAAQPRTTEVRSRLPYAAPPQALFGPALTKFCDEIDPLVVGWVDHTVLDVHAPTLYRFTGANDTVHVAE